ncbi:MAG: D-alanyl-D-alanine carboxypeptidase [Firmicutes bacterium]|nr:D-alanyl-D-alanine carboxypeptidase [Bacillota bacterium]
MKKILWFVICTFLFLMPISALEVEFNSENIIIYNYDINEVVYEKDSDEVISIASMTKIMTALVLIENINDLDTKVVLNQNHFRGVNPSASVAGFRKGQKVTYRDLLHGILLPSGADAVSALAVEVFGSNERLVEKMNERVKGLGLTHTNFINPVGLDDEGHYSTLREVSIFLMEALKNDTFKKIFTTRKYLTSDKSLTLYSTIVAPLDVINKDADYIIGSKTGYTTDAGRCLSTLLYDDEHNIYYLMVTAHAKNKVEPVMDVINTYEYLVGNYSNHTIVKNGDVVKSIKTKYAKEKEVDVVVSDTVEIFLKNSEFDKSKLVFNYEIPEELNKIMKQDSKIGTLTIFYGDEKIKTMDLLLAEDMNFSFGRFIFKTILPLSLLAIICVLIFKKKHS